MRKSKSKAEIEKLRKTVAIYDAMMQEILEAAKAGSLNGKRCAWPLNPLSGKEAKPLASLSFTVGKGWEFLHGHVHDTPLRRVPGILG